MKRIFALLLSAVIFNTVIAQVVWEETLPHTPNTRYSYENYGLSITERYDGLPGTVITGTQKFRGQEDIVIVSLDEQGVIEWHYRYQGLYALSNERPFAIAPTIDGYVVTGYVQDLSVSSQYKVFIMKIDQYGGIVWTEYFDDIVLDKNSFGLDIIVTNEGSAQGVQPGEYYTVTGYISDETAGDPLTTTSEKHILVLKTDDQGNMLWGNTYNTIDRNGGDFDMGEHILYSEDYGYLITGSFNAPATSDTLDVCQGILAMMIDFQGNISWFNSFTTVAADALLNSNEIAASATLSTVNSGFVYILSNHSDWHGISVVNLDLTNGNMSDAFQYELPSSEAFSGFTIEETLSGDFAITGYRKSNDYSSNTDNMPPYLLVIDIGGSVVSSEYVKVVSKDIQAVGGFFSYFTTTSGLPQDQPVIFTPSFAILDNVEPKFSLACIEKLSLTAKSDIHTMRSNLAYPLPACDSDDFPAYQVNYFANTDVLYYDWVSQTSAFVPTSHTLEVSQNPYDEVYCLQANLKNDEVNSLSLIDDNIVTNLYPNPTTGLLTLTGLSNDKVKIETRNLLGQLVFVNNYDVVNSNTVIDLSSCSSGVYLVYVTEANVTKVFKVAKSE